MQSHPKIDVAPGEQLLLPGRIVRSLLEGWREDVFQIQEPWEECRLHSLLPRQLLHVSS